MVYLDATAVLALVRRDDPGIALARWCNRGRSRETITSVVTGIEAATELGRTTPELLGELPRVLARTHQCSLDARICDDAGVLAVTSTPTAGLHVATALRVTGVGAATFVSADPVHARLARAQGLAVRELGVRELSPDPGRIPRASR